MIKVRPFFLSLLPLAAAVAAFWPCAFNGYLALDDTERILSNPFVRNLRPSMLAQLFTQPFHDMYAPLPTLVWWANASFLGGHAATLHVLSIVLHGLNGSLFFWLAYRFIGSARISAVVAILFVVHPMRVEVVAWAIVLCDLLAASCVLGSLLAYVHYCRAGSPRKPLLAVGYALFLLALLSKLSAVFLPAVMLVVGRAFGRRPFGELLRSQAPFWLTAVPFMIGARGVALGGAADWATVLSRSADVVIAGARTASFGARKLFEPGGLSVLYSWTDVRATDMTVLAALMGSLYFMARAQARTRNAFMAGAALFFLSLAPFSVAFFSRPAPFFDRYFYLPSAGLYLAIAAAADGMAASIRPGRMKRAAAAVLFAVVSFYAIVCAGLARERCRFWSDDVLFWREAVRSQARPSAFSLASLGAAMRAAGDADGAMPLLEQALKMDPDCAVAYYNRSLIHSSRGDDGAAIADLSRLIEIAPGMARAYLNRALALERSGDLRAAWADAARAAELEPRFGAYAYYRDALAGKLEQREKGSG